MVKSRYGCVVMPVAFLPTVGEVDRMAQKLTENDLLPTSLVVEQATIKALKGRVEADEVRKFLREASRSVAPALGATVSVNIAIWGKVKCCPTDTPWHYDATIWGGPAFFGESVGVMFTAYDTWDRFFANVTGVWVQGVADGAGLLQVTWFADAVLVGQFDGLAGAIGLLEAGGEGRWQHKACG
jgi:hypothetical protein